MKIAVFLFFIGLFFACDQGSNNSSEDKPSTQEKQKESVQANEEAIVTSDGIAVNIPSGALKVDAKVEIDSSVNEAEGAAEGLSLLKGFSIKATKKDGDPVSESDLASEVELDFSVPSLDLIADALEVWRTSEEGTNLKPTLVKIEGIAVEKIGEEFKIRFKTKVLNATFYLFEKEAVATDSVVPTISDAKLNFSKIASESLTVSWIAASDDVSDATDLQYKLVYSTSDNISTPPTAESNGKVAMPWTKNTISHNVKELKDRTKYFFTVLVKDAAGNTKNYSMNSATTLDGTAPTTNSDITFDSVTGTSLTVNWGEASDTDTPSNLIQYKLVVDDSDSKIDTIEEVEEISGANLLVDWTASLLTFDHSSLSQATKYCYAVLARDQRNNVGIYTPKCQNTTDTTNPTVGTGIAFSSIMETGVTVSWGAGSDNLTTANNLEYKLVSASDSTSIDTAAEIDGITGAAAHLDWVAATTTSALTGLIADTYYCFAVAVRDESGNMAAYSPECLTTDTTAPAISGGVFFATQTLDPATVIDSADIEWEEASDNVTATANLEYKIVTATSRAPIDTVAEVRALSGSAVLLDWTDATTTFSASNLAPSLLHCFAVAVRDEASNYNIYAPTCIYTNNPKQIERRTISAVPKANFGGVSGADTKCATYLAGSKAVIVHGTDRVAEAGSQVDWVLSPNQAYVRRYTNDLVAVANEDALFDFPLQAAISGAGVVMTGLGTNWSTLPNTCDGWTNGSDGNSGRGNGDALTESSFINPSFFGCAYGDSVYCVEQ